MASDDEKELEQEELEEPKSDGPTWEEMVQAVVQRRDAREMSALDAALNPAPAPPGRIVGEMRARARSLHSKRGALYTKGLELEIIGELEAIEALAWRVLQQRRAGTLGDAGADAAMRSLDPLIFAVRARYQALQEAQNLPFCTNARPPDPEARQRELDAINEYLARKNQRQAA